MLELLMGVVIFTFAMLPLISMGISTNRGAYSVGKHMMAGQLAASLMDRILALPYDEALKRTKSGSSGKILDDSLLVDILKQGAIAGSPRVKTDLDRSFTNFTYDIAASAEEKSETFEISIKISWRVDEGKEDTRQFMVLRALKFKETL